MNYPKKVTIGDITVRDGFQHEEIFVPTEAKVWVLEEMILAGVIHIFYRISMIVKFLLKRHLLRWSNIIKRTNNSSAIIKI